MVRKGIVVVGSANMDLVVMTDRFPQPGETLLGARFGMFPGGKGANQAVAAAKLGGRVHFIGKMGNDLFRERLMAGMRRDGVQLEHVGTDPREPTGIALITVDASGQNEILVVSGSNMKLKPRDIEHCQSLFSSACAVLLQLEIPLATVTRAAEIARRRGAAVILNPAPARALPTSLLKVVDYLTPNETELSHLTGVRVRDRYSAEAAAHVLLDMGVRTVLVTLGAKGCLLVSRAETRLFPARRVKPVDTTAAGDAFNGAFAFALGAGKAVEEAVMFANGVAAYSVTRFGAQSSMPTMKQLLPFLGGKGPRTVT